MSRNEIRAPGWRLTLLVLLPLAFALSCSKGCGGDQAAPAPSASAAPETPVMALAKLKAPPAALVYGGAKNPAQLITALKAFVGGAAPPTLDAAQVATQLAGEFQLQNANGLDLSKPARAALFDPEKHPQPLAYILGIKSNSELLATLPANKKPNDAGNAYSYTAGAGSFYVNFVPGSVVITQDAALFGTHQAFLKQLAVATLPEAAAFVASVKNAMTLYGAQITAGVAQMKQQMATMQRRPGAAPGMGGQQAAQFNKVMDWMVSTAKDLDYVALQAAFPKTGARIALELHPKAGTDFHKVVGVLGGQEFKLLKRLPAQSPLFMAFNMDADKAGDWAQEMVRWSFSMGLGSVQLPDAFVKATEDYWKASTGETVFVAQPGPDGKGLSLTALYGLRDAEKARTAYRAMMGMFEDPAVKKLYDELKLKVTHQAGAYQVGDIEVDRLSMKMDPAALATIGATGPLASLMTTMFNANVAMSQDVGVLAYGKDGKATLEAFLGGQVTGGLDQAPGVKRALGSAAPGCFLLIYVRPAELAKRIDLGEESPLAAMAAQLPPTTSGVALSASAKDGVMTVVLDAPTEQVGPATQLFGMLVGALMRPPGGGMRRPGMPPPGGLGLRGPPPTGGLRL